jgi:hypothetical protein
MKNFISQISSIFFLSMALIFYLNASFGTSANIGNHTGADMTPVNNSDQNQQSYIEDVQEQLQKTRELLKDLQGKHGKASSEERQQNVFAIIIKLTKELKHAERLANKFDVVDPEPWLRNKSEMDAVLADLQVAYDEAFPFLHDKTRFLQEAVHHAQVATEYGKEGKKDLFLKNTQSAKQFASLAQNQGLGSDVVKEGISELEDALFHIELDHLGQATTLTQGAYLHLSSALKHATALE